MNLQILSFAWKVRDITNVVSLTVFTKAWEITVLDKHVPLLTAIKPCVMYIYYKDINWITHKEDFAIWWWILEVNNSNAKVLTDALFHVDEVDFAKAEKAKKEAIDLMEKYKNSKDKLDMEKFIEAEDMLLRSIAQLKLWSMSK